MLPLHSITNYSSHMNIKLHTPSTLKAGSGLASGKQFFLSLLATSVSIILTFGTAAVIDHHKKQAAKKEMVMTVISDMDKTIEMIEKADTALYKTMRIQQDIAMHPEYYDSLRFVFPLSDLIGIEFPETTERIFSTSIETFNTIGDVNFVNEVTSFYMARHKYKETILDKLNEELEMNPIAQSLKSLFSISFPYYSLYNQELLKQMKQHRNECMRIMKVSNKDLSEFSKQQTSKKADPDLDSADIKLAAEFNKAEALIDQAREKYKD